MGHLTLLLLGTPEIRHAGQVASFPTRKALALLTYLAVEGGLHSREKLTALFWPESDADRGRTVLRRTLAYLREVLRAGEQPADTPRASLGERAFAAAWVEGQTMSLEQVVTYALDRGDDWF